MRTQATDYLGTARKKAGCKHCSKYVVAVAKKHYKNNARIIKKQEEQIAIMGYLVSDTIKSSAMIWVGTIVTSVSLRI